MSVVTLKLPSSKKAKIVEVECLSWDAIGKITVSRGKFNEAFQESQVYYDSSERIYWAWTALYEPKKKGGPNVQVIYTWRHEEED